MPGQTGVGVVGSAAGQVAWFHRLGFQIALLFALLLTGLVGAGHLIEHHRRMGQARQDMLALGRSFLPLVAHGVTPVLDGAFDDEAAGLDLSAVELGRGRLEATLHVVSSTSDFAYGALRLPGGEVLVSRASPAWQGESPEALFQGLSIDTLAERVTGDAIVVQSPIYDADGVTLMALVQLAFSLERINGRAQAELRSAAVMGGITLVLGLIPLFGIGHILISRPLGRLVRSAERMARGHLDTTIPITSRNEVGVLAAAFGGMAHALSGVVGRIQGMAHSVGDSLAVTERVSGRLLSGAHNQAAAVSDIRGSMQQLIAVRDAINATASEVDVRARAGSAASKALSHQLAELLPALHEFSRFVRSSDETSRQVAIIADEIVKHVSELAAHGEDAAQEVKKVENAEVHVSERSAKARAFTATMKSYAAAGKEAVDAVIVDMRSIEEGFEDIRNAVTELGARIDGIAESLAAIDGISAQTRLLALNASILASQAGSHGSAFAIVAGQIQELSERTRHSTLEIRGDLEQVRMARQATTVAVGRGVEVVDQGGKRSQDAERAIDSILTLATDCHHMIESIAATTLSQSGNTRTIAQRVAHSAVRARDILAGTRAQQATARQVTELVATIGSSLDGVMRILDREVAEANTVASTLGSLQAQTARIDAELAAQRPNFERIDAAVAHIGTIANHVLEDTREASSAVSSLGAQTEALVAEIATFTIADGHQRKMQRAASEHAH